MFDPITVSFSNEIRAKIKAKKSLFIDLDRFHLAQLNKDIKHLDSINEYHCFDYVFSEPLGSFSRPNHKEYKKFKFNKKTYKIPYGWSFILDQVDYINDKGIIVFQLNESALVKTKLWVKQDGHDDVSNTYDFISLESLLNSKGYYLNAIFGLPPHSDINKSQWIGRRLRASGFNDAHIPLHGSRSESLFAFTKQQSDDILIADLTEGSNNYKYAVNTFLSKKTGTDKDLDKGYFIKNRDFHTFGRIRAEYKVKLLDTQYKKYESKSISDLALQISDFRSNKEETDSFDADNSIFLLKRPKPNGKLPVSTTNRPTTDSYFQIELNDLIRSQYLGIYMNSHLGKLSYEASLTIPDGSRPNDYILTKEDLQKMLILFPEIKVQDQIIDAHNKIIKLQKSIDVFNDSLSINPGDFISERISQIDDMLDQVGKLNDADRIRAMIRGIIEDGKSEFKQTWQLPTGGEKKELWEETKNLISATVFKVINSYLNANGGTLVIGVVDSTHEITGLGPELEHYFKKDNTIEKRIDRFENKFHKSLNKAFSKEFVDLVSYRPVLIEDKYVWMVVCESAQKPCVVIDPKVVKILNGQEFYVREGGNSVPYSGQDRTDYIDMHFYNS